MIYYSSLVITTFIFRYISKNIFAFSPKTAWQEIFPPSTPESEITPGQATDPGLIQRSWENPWNWTCPLRSSSLWLHDQTSRGLWNYHSHSTRSSSPPPRMPQFSNMAGDNRSPFPQGNSKFNLLAGRIWRIFKSWKLRKFVSHLNMMFSCFSPLNNSEEQKNQLFHIIVNLFYYLMIIIVQI